MIRFVGPAAKVDSTCRYARPFQGTVLERQGEQLPTTKNRFTGPAVEAFLLCCIVKNGVTWGQRKRSPSQAAPTTYLQLTGPVSSKALLYLAASENETF